MKMEKIYLQNSYAGIGQCVVKFQTLEALLDYLIHGLLTLPIEHTNILLSEYSFKAKIGIYNALIKNLFNEEDKLINGENLFEFSDRFVNSMRECSDLRNKIVHSHWIDTAHGYNQYIFRVKHTSKSKSGFKMVSQDFDQEAIDYVLEKIEITNNMMSEISSSISISYDRDHMIPLLAHKNIPVESLLKVMRDEIRKNS